MGAADASSRAAGRARPRGLASMLAVATLAGCAMQPVGPWGGPPGRVPAAAGPNVPPGQMPPPGACRIWFPGRPPGQQPPPGDCARLQFQVPPGAVLLQG